MLWWFAWSTLLRGHPIRRVVVSGLSRNSIASFLMRRNVSLQYISPCIQGYQWVPAANRKQNITKATGIKGGEEDLRWLTSVTTRPHLVYGGGNNPRWFIQHETRAKLWRLKVVKWAREDFALSPEADRSFYILKSWLWRRLLFHCCWNIGC